MLAFEGGLGVVALALGALCGVAPLTTLRFTFSSLVVGVLAVVPMLVLLAALWLSTAEFLRRIRERVHRAVSELFARASLPEIASIAAAAGIGEEILFRGFLQAGLEQIVGRWPALVGASVAFGLVHPITRAYVGIAAAFGLYLGVLWLATGSLLAPIVAHGLYDFIALVAITRLDDRNRASASGLVFVSAATRSSRRRR
jgi:membrane protease YdiL (CAAX protease family)